MARILTDAPCLTPGVTEITEGLDAANVACDAESYRDTPADACCQYWGSLVPAKEDFFMSYSTLPGSGSFRDDTGAFYIKHLDRHLRDPDNKGLSLDRVLTKVTTDVTNEVMESTNRSKYQMPFHVYTGGKLIHL